MHKLIEDILNRGFTLEVEKNQELGIIFKMNGFYKSGEIILHQVDDDYYAKSRYNQEDYIPDFESLVRLNHYWWLVSKERYDGWKIPDKQWLPFYLEFDLVKISEETVYTYR
ncbi:MAG: hypothetical protein PHC28_06710 [Flavobacterium sp.]|uniref:hypothetical protein n=1 Tax=Flavobacterium sp. TaxID=239 RepID=UPI002632E68D|nr:hypothetical protein [Flavobacterium sp.]MDD5150161.1 hypothetical protein [Flavobacterium sp.]